MKTLPLPSLDDTFATYLQWLRPLVDDKTYANSAKALEDFRHLEAPKLQRLLEQRADLAAPLGVSYGHSEELAAFWQALGFREIHRSTSGKTRPTSLRLA